MKKIVCFLVSLGVLAGCRSTSDTQKATAEMSKAYYSDWDRAIRMDVDMQNMYLNTPRHIKQPIDMYMAMALALKYNYTRRMVSYEESLIKAGKSSLDQLQEVLNKAGYVNTTNSQNLSPDLKVAWNILDLSTVYYQNTDPTFKETVAVERSRKVIHNILQEARLLYWKTLTAQRLLPVIDDMSEFMSLEIDEMNASAKELADKGEVPTREEFLKKRDYMESVQKLTALKHKLETAEADLASLMGLHPSTTFHLVGAQYGNFDLPEIKAGINQLEWMALTNRPELRVHDLLQSSADKELIIQKFHEENKGKCENASQKQDTWSKDGTIFGMNLIEEMSNANASTLETLHRQRMTSLVLNQVYVSYATYMAAMEDYQLNMEIANTSEDIAEDYTYTDGSKATVSQLEASRAIADEVKAFLSYVDVQEALGNLYATIGVDALPYYMLSEKPSTIALYLRGQLDKWMEGELIPDNRPYLMDIPAKRPPVKLSGNAKLKDVTVDTGEPIKIDVPLNIFESLQWEGDITTKSGLIDDSPLPKWLKYDALNHRYTGMAMPGDGGVYHIKVYASDNSGNVAYATFNLTVREVYIPGKELRGLTEGRQATVMRKCTSPKCRDAYINTESIGKEVEKTVIK